VDTPDFVIEEYRDAYVRVMRVGYWLQITNLLTREHRWEWDDDFHISTDFNRSCCDDSEGGRKVGRKRGES
jgi:hypothetical protein